MENYSDVLSEQLFNDIQKLRDSDLSLKERIGLEIMALNAIVNSEKEKG